MHLRCTVGPAYLDYGLTAPITRLLTLMSAPFNAALHSGTFFLQSKGCTGTKPLGYMMQCVLSNYTNVEASSGLL